jgi:AraC-like DNA-binding protein
MDNSDTRRLGALPTATGGIARLAYARVEQAGIEVGPLLNKAGLTAAQIKDPGVRINVQHQITFLNLAARALRDDLLGFHLAQQLDLREIGLLYYVLASSESLAEALRRAARYSSIVNEGISLTLFEGRDVAMTFDYVGVARHLDRHQIEFWMTIVIRLCRQLVGLRLAPLRVRLTHRSNSNISELAALLGEDIEFGAKMDEVAFAATAKDMPVVSADPYLNGLLNTIFEEALSRRPTNRASFQVVVENAIAPLLPHGKARAAEISRRLCMSQRTFSRRLSLEGLTFSEALENVRRDLVEQYLTDQGLSISQIAWLLGYQEVSAFTHAFKRWTGRTPRAARAQREWA